MRFSTNDSIKKLQHFSDDRLSGHLPNLEKKGLPVGDWAMKEMAFIAFG